MPGVAERFAQVMTALAEESRVSYGKPGKTFGSSALKVNDKNLCDGVVGRVLRREAAKDAGRRVRGAARAGRCFEASRGRPMKEWLQVDSESDEDWVQLGREVLSFVRGLP